MERIEKEVGEGGGLQLLHLKPLEGKPHGGQLLTLNPLGGGSGI